MKITEQAVQAALDAYCDCDTDGEFDPMRAALTAAAPHMSGVKVKDLVWRAYEDEQGTPDHWYAVTVTDEYYFIGLRSDGYTVSFDYSDRGNFNTLEAAKAAAQADYEKRILSALEPSSARDQALEEAAQVLEKWGDIYGNNAAAAIRALKSQPSQTGCGDE